MESKPLNLKLRRTCIAGQYVDDDYCAYDAGQRVGRIMLHSSTPLGPQWAWQINLPVPIPSWCVGRAASLEEAKGAFRTAWEQFKPTLGRGKASRASGLAEDRGPAGKQESPASRGF